MYRQPSQKDGRGWNAVVLVGKPETTDYLQHLLKGKIRFLSATSKKGIRNKDRLDLIFLVCDFQCSLAYCYEKFELAHFSKDIPFAVVRFLPVGKPDLLTARFSLSFFEKYHFSAGQENIIDKLRSSESYSRNLISRLHPSQIASKVLTLQTEIAENPNAIFDLRELAEKVRLSQSWTSHRFKEITGMTLQRFVMRNHLCYALWKIISTDKLIKAIALDLGYKPLAFCQRFRIEFGVAPTFLRKNYFDLLAKNRYRT
jgi:AraC-like DNA-binding protein